MKKIDQIKKSNIVIFAIALLHLCITFVTDRRIFTFPSAGSDSYVTALSDYCICKCISFVVLLLFYRGLYALIFERKNDSNTFKSLVKTALPYLVLILAVLAIKLPAGYISNDENAIYSNAVTLTHDTWFYYLTTYYYIVSLMLIPFKYGPIIIKVIIQFLTVGYVVYRIRKYFQGKLGLWGYALFLMYPVIAYTTSAHRLPVYFLLYLVLFTKLLFDGLEGAEANPFNLGLVIISGAILTQWRTEGIYLVVLIPILCLFVYKNLRTRKNIIVFIMFYFMTQYLVSVPQNGFAANNLDGAANDRMKPFYAYTITNMYRNGLDLEKNAQDLAIVDRYMSLEVIEAINEHYVDINYEDVLILYQEGYIGVRPEATVEDFINYSDAVKRIFINNPDVFIRTRIGAFCYAALPYHITFSGWGLRSLISFGISLVKSFAYNLFIPCFICLALCLYSLIKKRWYSFFVFGGLLAHWFIVFILAPASYFKYYFPIYIMAYFYLLILAMWLYAKKKGRTINSPLY